MAINNFDTIERKAIRNSDGFNKQLNTFMDYGSNATMLTNLASMKNRMSTLIEGGYIKTGEFDYQNLSGIIEGAMKVHQKPNKSLDDIADFYMSYTNFGDTYNFIKGES